MEVLRGINRPLKSGSEQHRYIDISFLALRETSRNIRDQLYGREEVKLLVSTRPRCCVGFYFLLFTFSDILITFLSDDENSEVFFSQGHIFL
jgi:hypothetical protein